MAAEPSPLFRPDIIRSRLHGFELPERAEEAYERIERWANLFSGAPGQEFNEEELRPDFISHVFYHVLGYTGPASGEESRYTLAREKLVEANGKFADAVLGEFSTESGEFAPIAAVEVKGPKDPLERAHGGRSVSAVSQGYQYAINLPCDWIVATNLREIRLYHKGSTERTFERFAVSELADDRREYRRFVYLLGAERVVPKEGGCHFKDLLEASEAADERVTTEFYEEYSERRIDILRQLREHNPELDSQQVLTATQTLLDRVLFIAFCEDRGLLPPRTLEHAYEQQNPYNPQPTWENFKGLFRAIDEGGSTLDIPAYDGGLFEEDSVIQGLEVPDKVCAYFKRLGDYDYRPPSEAITETGGGDERALIDVEVLGHIFEQSITDLERLRSDLSGEDGELEGERTRRQREGAFYTPTYVTQHIVSEALSPVLEERFEQLRDKHHEAAENTAVRALDNPRAYDPNALNAPQRDALIEFWESWLDELQTVKVLDPACGSGAFLIEAFDQLHAEYQQAVDRLAELRPGEFAGSLFDPDRSILQNNIFGVDINEEAVQICRLSIWIKTAKRGKELTDLDHNIRAGNSIVDNRSVDENALRWNEAFPEVFGREEGGFDVVVGNPPYIRAENLPKAQRSHLEENYATYRGNADIYVCFFERGVDLLREGGYLSYIVTNKWLKVGYAKALRRFFTERTSVQSVLDLGHAREVFPDADVFPSIVTVRRSSQSKKSDPVRVCVIPRDELTINDLGSQVRKRAFEIPSSELEPDGWSLEPPQLSTLFHKMEEQGVPLPEYMGVEPKYGIKTGLNRAFLIDEVKRDELIGRERSATEVIKPFLRGEDIDRWTTGFQGRWMILLQSSQNTDWPWSGKELSEAEEIFENTYPSLYEHLSQYRERLRDRYDQGEYWWELRSCSYYGAFEEPKIVHTDIAWEAEFAYIEDPMYLLNTAYTWPTSDLYLLGVVNSPLMWAYLWRAAPHGKDEALRLIRSTVNEIPVADPAPELKEEVRGHVQELIALSERRQSAMSRLLNWLEVEFGIDEPGKQLQAAYQLTRDDFLAEVRERTNERDGRLTSEELEVLTQEYRNVLQPLRRRQQTIAAHERAVADLVNQAYGLTEEEVDLLWRTAPPRMPVDDPRVTRTASPTKEAGEAG